MSPSWIAWLLGAWCGVLALAGVLLSGAALFWDRSRGRRRCPRCWYDMAGTAGLRCPECGRVSRRERDLFRTRRMRGRLMVGLVLVLLAAPAAFAVPRVNARGWPGAIPTTALMAASPWLPPSGFIARGRPTGTFRERLSQELGTRFAAHEVWPAQSALFVRFWAGRAVDYNPITERPGPTQAWEWLCNFYWTRNVGDWGLRSYRDAVLPRTVCFRTRWAADRPFLILVEPDTLAIGEAFFSYTLRIDGVEVPAPKDGDPAMGRRALDKLAVGMHDVELEQRLTAFQPGVAPSNVLWSHHRKERVEVVDTLEHAVRCWTDDEMRAFIGRAVRIEAVRLGENAQVSMSFLVDPLGGGPGDPTLQSPVPDLHFTLGVLGGKVEMVEWPVNETELASWPLPVVEDAQGRWAVGAALHEPAGSFDGHDFWFTVHGDANETMNRPAATSFWNGTLRYKLKGALGRFTLPAPE